MQKLLVLPLALMFGVSAEAARFVATLDGLQEVPPVVTSATGTGVAQIVGDWLYVHITYQDLTSPLTIAHIHCCAPSGVNVGIAVDLDMIPLPQTLSGSFSRQFDLNAASTYRAAFLNNFGGGTVAGARMALLDAFKNELAYFNLHTQQFPPGEIRGQIMPIPEPGTWVLLIAGFGLVGSAARRRLESLA
ncbi:MAG: CHRD domain-containing protein [Sphingomonadaceae bacterium]